MNTIIGPSTIIIILLCLVGAKVILLQRFAKIPELFNWQVISITGTLISACPILQVFKIIYPTQFNFSGWYYICCKAIDPSHFIFNPKLSESQLSQQNDLFLPNIASV